MQRLIIALASGLIFGAGLVISEMANPVKVQNFLDPFGHWDPSLAFVMGVEDHEQYEYNCECKYNSGTYEVSDDASEEEAS